MLNASKQGARKRGAKTSALLKINRIFFRLVQGFFLFSPRRLGATAFFSPFGPAFAARWKNFNCSARLFETRHSGFRSPASGCRDFRGQFTFGKQTNANPSPPRAQASSFQGLRDRSCFAIEAFGCRMKLLDHARFHFGSRERMGCLKPRFSEDACEVASGRLQSLLIATPERDF